MKKTMFITLIIAALVLTAGGYLAYKFLNQKNMSSQNKTTQITQPTTAQNIILDTLEKQAYSNNQYGFKINAPKGWRVDESGQSGSIVLFMNTLTDKEGANIFSANISVDYKPAQGLKLDDYVNAAKETLSKGLQNYKSTEDKTASLNGTLARIIGETFVVNKFHLRDLHLVAIKGERAYVVTGTVFESTWNQYKDLIESSLLTFSLN